MFGAYAPFYKEDSVLLDNRFPIEEGFTYDDVLLVPRYSEVVSRKDVSTSVSLCGIDLDVPIISANMDTITGVKMAIAIYKAGGLGILHRYQSVEDSVFGASVLADSGVPPVLSIGVNAPGVRSSNVEEHDRALRDIVEKYVCSGAVAICLDVAHAHSGRVLDTLYYLKGHFESLPFIVGNVATPDGAISLASNGADCVKVGVGPGSVCSTRTVTGHGYPQLSAVWNIRTALNENLDYRVDIIADGGLKTYGDVVKALAAGADAVMSGFLFAGADEVPVPGVYRGMASAEARGSFGGVDVGEYTPEGTSVSVVNRGPVSKIVSNIRNSIRSGCSYSGVNDVKDLRKNARFVRVTQQGYQENLVRA